MDTAFTPARASPTSWNAFASVDALVDAVLAELMAVAGTRSIYFDIVVYARRAGFDALKSAMSRF